MNVFYLISIIQHPQTCIVLRPWAGEARVTASSTSVHINTNIPDNVFHCKFLCYSFVCSSLFQLLDSILPPTLTVAVRHKQGGQGGLP